MVIIGGMMAILGLLTGVLITTPQYHLALMGGGEPIEMSWRQLVGEGPGQRGVVRLTDVAIEQPNQLAALAEYLNLDMEVTANEQAATEVPHDRDGDPAAPIDLAAALRSATEPLKIYPAGQDPDQFPALIVVPQTGREVERAKAEIEAGGTLTGRFIAQPDPAARLRSDQAFADASVPITQVKASTGGRSSATKPEDGESLAGNRNGPKLRYVYESLPSAPDLTEAEQWFWCSGLAVAFGLVLCGAGGPSLVCCFFFQGPSLLSLLGYPMRYGRATKTTRLVYAAIGLGLMIFGLKTMLWDAELGEADGDVMKAAFAFVPCFVGAAAVLGAGANLAFERLNLSLEPASRPPVEPKMSMTEACSLGPVKAKPELTFQDRQMTVPENPLPPTLQELAEALADVGFEQYEHLSYADGLAAVDVLVQLGCQEMVVADVELPDRGLVSRLVSVLQDGFCVITLSANCCPGAPSRYGTHGQYSHAETSNPLEMLSDHLQQTIAMAEKRDTAVVTLESSEFVLVAELGRRVLADIRRQYGEEQIEVEPATYGRFQFPGQPVDVTAC